MGTDLAQLSRLSDREILRLRLCDLTVLKGGIAGTWLEGCAEALYRDLAAAGLRHFRPRLYFGDEWFCPDGIPAIAVPFYLAHPRLAELQRRMMTETEGGSRYWCMKLLRHEAGHGFDHAFRVSRRPQWRQMFGGSPGQRYNPDVYLADPKSRDFVRHLPDNYAQAHPDEDFAETFAVAVTPGLDWRRRYRDYPGALAKLAYVEALIVEHRHVMPRGTSEPDCYPAARMRSTLAQFYAKRRAAVRAQRRAVKLLAAKRSGPRSH